MSITIHKHLVGIHKNISPKLSEIIEKNGTLILERKENKEFFPFLAKTVVGQQLSNKAAESIWLRILDTAQKNNSPIVQLFLNEEISLLKSCGLSGNKIKAITLLSKTLENELLHPTNLDKLSADQIREKICELWGFGPWSGDMTALFFFGKPDIWSANDTALERAIRILTDGSSTEATKIIEKSQPYRSYLSLHLWRAIDTDII